jgi:hypothetical protein
MLLAAPSVIVKRFGTPGFPEHVRRGVEVSQTAGITNPTGASMLRAPKAGIVLNGVNESVTFVNTFAD